MLETLIKLDYQLEYKKQLKKNISLVRKEINKEDFILKIQNHAIKFERSFEEIKEKIMIDDMYAEIFAKDPAKQNIYEKTAAKYLSSVDYIENFENLPNNAKVFVYNGKIVSRSYNNMKSIDFIFNVGKYNFYAQHKYIKALYGGAQDNQYTDVRIFLNNCNRINEGDNYFIAICDGPYFRDKISSLNLEFGSSRVIAMTIDDVIPFINAIVE